MTSPTLTLGQLAEQLAGELRPASAASFLVKGVTGLRSATADRLVFAEDARAFAEAIVSGAAAVLTGARIAEATDQVAEAGNCPLLIVAQPKLAFAQAAALLRNLAQPTGVHPQACIAASARLGAEISIGPSAVIGDAVTLGAGTRVDAGAVVGDGCVLGPGCHLYPRAVLYAGVQLGARVVVHAGAVLGSAGFGYVRDTQTGEYLQFPQQGSLVIEDDVEIGANSTIDRGALEETRIGRGVKIDNLVHVGHNVRIARNVVIAAQTGISGSSSIGAGAVVAGQVGIADHVAIGEGVILGAQCGVPSNKQIRGPGVLFWGTPARPITQYLKELATLARLTRNRGGR
jgi:UDP-3-O-[3-hydroxymyristoyl] glucosamine N-acyltransferase